MSRARNPRNFPRMKVRGVFRRRVAPMQRMLGAFDRLPTFAAQASTAMTRLTQQIKDGN